MSNHTPGPWRIVRYGDHNPLIETDEITVAEVLDDCHPDTEQQEANARLIAASPDLYHALKQLTGWYTQSVPEGVWELVAAAIAKAEGT